MQGRGGVSPDVPALTSVSKALTPAQLRKIIDHGLGESANPTKPYMPVWGEVISPRQVSDLIAYLRGWAPRGGDCGSGTDSGGAGAAVAGASLYVRYGCHSPNGLGGVPNPRSPDKTIPPLSGADFKHEFNTDGKIIDFIRSGSVIGRAPMSRCHTGAGSFRPSSCGPSPRTSRRSSSARLGKTASGSRSRGRNAAGASAPRG